MLRWRIVMFIFLSLLVSGAQAADEINIDKNGIAVSGYDPVAYFNGTPTFGKDSIKYSYQGAAYLFSNYENRQRFILDPSRYIPSFGGYCAFGVRMGTKLEIDTTAFEVVDNKLYLLLNHATKKMWENDKHENISIAEKLWPELKPVPMNKLQ